MTISEVSEKYGISCDTLRWYEKIGLLKNVGRKSSGLRDYNETNCKSSYLIYSCRLLPIVIDIYLSKIRLITPKIQGFQPFLLVFNDFY